MPRGASSGFLVVTQMVTQAFVVWLSRRFFTLAFDGHFGCSQPPLSHLLQRHILVPMSFHTLVNITKG